MLQGLPYCLVGERAIPTTRPAASSVTGFHVTTRMLATQDEGDSTATLADSSKTSTTLASCAGPGDMLALFRCLSCKYSFSADLKQLQLLGAPGRVFVSGEVNIQTFSIQDEHTEADPTTKVR